MRILLVYPKYPETLWNFKYALKFIGKKAALPPLGLLTVASMFPQDWEKKVIDMNIDNLSDEDIRWADYVFISALIVQKSSVREIIRRCKKVGRKVVAGGPLFTSYHEDFNDVDHLVLGEAEITLPLFLEDIKLGSPKHIYQSDGWADISKTPIPSWGLISIKKYDSLSVQYSRGCPFNCDFCDVTSLFGRVPRTKGREQILQELDALYNIGWREKVFFVDDNLIGNKEKLKKEILPSIIEWRRKRNYPLAFTTQASINLADDEELMDLMAKAGFGTVFLGIETPNEDSLAECGKFQNKNRDLTSCVKKIQRKGMNVLGGFIVGFDSDGPSIFERQIKFIQNSGIAIAMVGILTPFKGTRLYNRLKKENRMLARESSGDSSDGTLDFVPKMSQYELIAGYKKVIRALYSPKYYCQRVINFLLEYRSCAEKKVRFHFYNLRTIFQSILILGFEGRAGLYFWKLIFWTLLNRPGSFPSALSLAIQGYHFRKTFISKKIY
ncbi:MAG: B12-binding domain-containing radical SAM protein [Candidatus Wildermuthbacteria bacterium]|nr:B12-binding domain-containing radical SAM protein [Candidatus Wildermuthbacteria bacterium]